VTVEIDPATVPELGVILRTNKLGKVRVLDVACDQGHRLVEVLQIPGRGRLALGIDTTMIHLHGKAPHWWWSPKREKYEISHSGRWLGLWVDKSDVEIETVNGRQLHNRFTFTCRGKHCSQEITLPWLREQLALGHRRIVYTMR
jgi:hypothetical protein